MVQPTPGVTPENVQNYSPAVRQIEAGLAQATIELQQRKATRHMQKSNNYPRNPDTASKYTIQEVVDDANKQLKS